MTPIQLKIAIINDLIKEGNYSPEKLKPVLRYWELINDGEATNTALSIVAAEFNLYISEVLNLIDALENEGVF